MCFQKGMVKESSSFRKLFRLKPQYCCGLSRGRRCRQPHAIAFAKSLFRLLKQLCKKKKSIASEILPDSKEECKNENSTHRLSMAYAHGTVKENEFHKGGGKTAGLWMTLKLWGEEQLLLSRYFSHTQKHTEATGNISFAGGMCVNKRWK